MFVFLFSHHETDEKKSLKLTVLVHFNVEVV